MGCGLAFYQRLRGVACCFWSVAEAAATRQTTTPEVRELRMDLPHRAARIQGTVEALGQAGQDRRAAVPGGAARQLPTCMQEPQ